MAPYVPQWFAALGTQESRYILYKVGASVLQQAEKGGMRTQRLDRRPSVSSGWVLVCWCPAAIIYRPQ